MAVINIHQAKTHFAELIQRALRGEDIVVAKHGHPLVRLVPVNALALEPRQFGRRHRTLSNEDIAGAMAPVDESDLGTWDGP